MIQPTGPCIINKLAYIVSLLLLWCFIVTACTGKPDQVLPVGSATTPSVQPAVTTAVVPTHGVTLTSTVTDTPTPDITKSMRATATPTLPPTPTPRPTLSEDQAWDEVYVQLHAQPLCRFPCWWGLQPGKTTFEEAREFYRHLGFEQSVAAPPYINKQFILRLPKGPVRDKFHIQISTQMYEHALGTMQIWASKKESDMFYQYMEPYSIEHVINAYGKPDRVLIHTPSYYGENHIRGDGGNYAFDISLFYDAIGVLISYEGEPSTFISGGKQALICPQLKDKQVDSLFINLRTPDDTIPLARFAPRYKSVDENYYLPSDEVTHLTIDEFVKVVTKPNQACFGVLTQ